MVVKRMSCEPGGREFKSHFCCKLTRWPCLSPFGICGMIMPAYLAGLLSGLYHDNISEVIWTRKEMHQCWVMGVVLRLSLVSLCDTDGAVFIVEQLKNTLCVN
ncbi:UNVERIFIED_CONTAM: hypothetical protein K2H54_062080 [Gekko kuhli]